MLQEFCNWLEATPFSQVIETTGWMIPMIQSTHIVVVSFLFWSVLSLNARLLFGFGRSVSVSAVAARFLPWVWPAIGVLLFTGSLLTCAEPARQLENPSFQLKMLFLAIALTLTSSLKRQIAADPAALDAAVVPVSAKLKAGVAMAFWIFVVICGRTIAYTQ